MERERGKEVKASACKEGEKAEGMKGRKVRMRKETGRSGGAGVKSH